MKSRRTSYLLAILSFLALPWLTLTLSRGIQSHLAEHYRVLEVFDVTARLDSEIDKSILMARSFLLPNYDGLASLSREEVGICAKLREEISVASGGISEDIEIRLADFCSRSNTEANLMEKFKQKNAVIHSSLRFLPSVIDSVHGLPENDSIQELYMELLQYSLDPNPSTYQRAVKRQKFLSAELKGMPGHKGSAGRELLSHTQVVLKNLLERHNLEREILDDSLQTSLEKLRFAYLASYERSEAVAYVFRITLFLFTIVAAGLLFSLFARLQSTKDKLDELNHGLEESVQERTRELTAALHELEQKQQQLLHASRMSALGEMAGGIAHEINSPLAAISLQAELVECSLDPDSALLPPVKSIQVTVGRISKIILGLRRFSHGGRKGEKTQVSVGEIIADTLSFCGEKLKNSFVELRWEKDGDAHELTCQPEQISQVLLNLINNAVDAVGASPEKWVKVSSEKTSGLLRIYVEDSGPGIPPELQQKMMQPFFTTKAVGKGTGLGLSISRNILESHGGRLWIDVNCPRTRFVMEIPAA